MTKLSTFIDRIAARVLVRLINNDKTVAEAVAELIDSNREVQKAVRNFITDDNQIDTHIENIARDAVDTDSFITERDLDEQGYAEQRELEELTEQVAGLVTEAGDAMSEASAAHDAVNALQKEIAGLRLEISAMKVELNSESPREEGQTVVRLDIWNYTSDGVAFLDDIAEGSSKAEIVTNYSDELNNAVAYDWYTYEADHNGEPKPGTQLLERHVNPKALWEDDTVLVKEGMGAGQIGWVRCTDIPVVFDIVTYDGYQRYGKHLVRDLERVPNPETGYMRG